MCRKTYNFDKMHQLIHTSDRSSFAYYTVKNRIASIVEKLIAHYQLNSDSKLSVLKQTIPDAPLPLIQELETENALQNQFIKEINEAITQEQYRWDNAPFIVVESYFYHKLLELTKQDGIQEDYFSFIKNDFNVRTFENMQKSYAEYQKLSTHTVDNFGTLLKLDLLGNKADLSQSSDTYSQTSASSILIDHSAEVFEKIENSRQVDIILDNAGEELFADLILSHYLLTKTNVKEVVLHFKIMPYFVSDALISDFNYLMHSLKKQEGLKDFVEEIEALIQNNQLTLKSHEYWSSSNDYKNIPSQLNQTLSQSDLLIFKGDLNYRKLVGDYDYDCTIKTNTLVDYLPTDCLMLRVLKSEVMVGLEASQIPSESDHSWKYNGEYSLMELVESN
ncbi:protein-glutamate O-methyltransferase family protein [Flammeovirga aprica JL-4]|uniref:Protein-glutamate O-methyltransferase family protein n=2 Tax=Flammeovirga aprica TaxID=29528 RepID=A0A7X9P3G6_9BACT|nr:protein-glutamate O-methyltransferase family protein [Flammeovirga aprica JL-4]